MVNITMLKKKYFSFLFIFFIFLFDRLSKFLILKVSQPLDHFNLPVTSFLNLNLIWNDGIAFGLFSFDDILYYHLLTLLIVLITLALIWLMLNSKGVEKLCFSMIIGGSFGNIFDRLYYNSVIDFIDFHINNFHWFIFNVADIFITLGVILLIYLEIFSKKKI
jgi:signal peptidase II